MREIDLTGQPPQHVHLHGAELRAGGISDCRLRGTDLWDVEISGELPTSSSTASTSGRWSRPSWTVATPSGR